MKPRHTIALLLLVLTANRLPAQSALTQGKPADVGMSADVLKQGVVLFEKAVAQDDLRGAVLLVAHKGKIVLHETVGWRNKDKELLMQKNTLFHVASNTKPIVATAVLMLVEECKIDLDAEVCKYLPAFDNDKSRTIKVRHLLSHTSGLRIPTIFLQPLLQKSAEHPDAPSLRLEAERFAAIGPAEKPGTTYSYNNPGYNTLGALIEVVSKQPLETFLSERIYRPLGMADAYHRDRKAMVDRRSVIYSKKDAAWKVTYRPGDPPLYPFVRGSGGLITTAADYAKFLQMFLNGGVYNGQRLLKPETVKVATTQHTRSLYSAEEQKKQTAFYGFGWQVTNAGYYGHGGSDGTYAWVDPQNDLIGVVFTQSPGGKNPREEFIRLVRQAVVEKTP